MSVTAATNAISTKSRAKFGKCLNEKNYTDLTQMSTLQEVVSYLKQHTWYESVLANVKESAVHRGNLEKMLYAAIRRQICDLCDFDRSVGSNSFRFVDYVEDRQNGKQIDMMCVGHCVAERIEHDANLRGKSDNDYYQHEFSVLDRAFPYPTLMLNQIGIPVWDVLHVRTEQGDYYVEMQDERHIAVLLSKKNREL